MRYQIFIFCLLFSLVSFAGDKVKIGIFTGANHTKVNITVTGIYALIGDGGVLATLSKDDKNIQLDAAADGVNATLDGRFLGRFKRVMFQHYGAAEFKVYPAAGKANSYIFPEDLIVTSVLNRLQLVNSLDIESYVPGVVEAEGGKGHLEEYYKVQSVISRTYALNNLRRHEAEGFHLCDGTHCQVYHGRSRFEPLIAAAAAKTNGIVIVDDNIDLITAAFHSNCGGHTINAEDVWSKPLSYCVGRADTFCLLMPHSNWEKSIPRSQWTDYLESKRYPVSDSTTANALAYFPSEKQIFFVDSTFKIPLRVIRSDLKLRSTFFTVHQQGDQVTFIGQGFGHGVGLCQEGAMRMAQLGYAYDEIIHYYYKNVHLVPKHLIWFFKFD
ncbi:MAG: SpoIID/LytB domain-containing protein [Crocinitomicaceae bacterium]|nr:SpoIID/LytB domain-containing protein [Crocinitomicaceae bacterium]